jgi:hypothetical protein
MAKRRRLRVDPLALQPRTPTRRPGDFNAQAGAHPDPNVEFIATHSLAGGGDATGVIRFFRWLSRRKGR